MLYSIPPCRMLYTVKNKYEYDFIYIYTYIYIYIERERDRQERILDNLCCIAQVTYCVF